MNAKVAVDKLNQAAPQTVPENGAGGGWDEFLSSDELVPVHIEAAERMQESILAEMETLFRENRWEDALSLFYPIEEKAPEIVELGVDVSVREKNAFALGHLQRFDEAIVELNTQWDGEIDYCANAGSDEDGRKYTDVWGWDDDTAEGDMEWRLLIISQSSSLDSPYLWEEER